MSRAAEVEAAVADMRGPAALPRSNGELVFAAPWESRAFGMAVALYRQGLYLWDDFRHRLIEEIRAHDRGEGELYYRHWLASFERLLVEQGVLSGPEVEQRMAELGAADDHGHDHGHGHGHDHGDHSDQSDHSHRVTMRTRRQHRARGQDG